MVLYCTNLSIWLVRLQSSDFGPVNAEFDIFNVWTCIMQIFFQISTISQPVHFQPLVSASMTHSHSFPPITKSATSVEAPPRRPLVKNDSTRSGAKVTDSLYLVRRAPTITLLSCRAYAPQAYVSASSFHRVVLRVSVHLSLDKRPRTHTNKCVVLFSFPRVRATRLFSFFSLRIGERLATIVCRKTVTQR